MLVGYARVSTLDQDTALQMDALGMAGVHRVFSEKTSSVGARPQLQKALASMSPGSTLVVWKLDRIARSLLDLLSILAKLKERGIGLRSLTEPIDTSSPIGEFMVQVLGAVAQLEKAMIRERTLAGQVAAYQRGKRWGGKDSRLPREHWDEVRRCYASGWWTMQQLGEWFGVSRRTIAWVIYPERSRMRRKGELRLPVLRTFLPPSATQ
ncbi:recombinase family protein [Sphingomonas sp. NCPPB 2930]